MPDRMWLQGNGSLDGSLGGRRSALSGSRGGALGSTRAWRLAQRIARGALADRLTLWRMVWIETGPASCPTARSQCFGKWFAMLRRMVRDGPGVLPDGSLAALRRMVRDASADGSRWARRTARRLACGASADGSRRFGAWFEMGPAYCPTARSWRFGRSSDASADGLDLDGPGVLPDGSLAALRRIRRLPNGSHDNCVTGKLR